MLQSLFYECRYFSLYEMQGCTVLWFGVLLFICLMANDFLLSNCVLIFVGFILLLQMLCWGFCYSFINVLIGVVAYCLSFYDLGCLCLLCFVIDV